MGNSLRLQSPSSPSRVSTRSQTVLTPRNTSRTLLNRQTDTQKSAKRKLVGGPQTVEKGQSDLAQTSTEERPGLERLRAESESDNSVTPRRLLRSTNSTEPGSASRKRPGSPRSDHQPTRKSPRVISQLPPRVTYSK